MKMHVCKDACFLGVFGFAGPFVASVLIIKILIVCAICVPKHKGQRTILWSWFSAPTFVWDETQAVWLVLQVLYPLSHPVGPYIFSVWTWGQVF